MGKSMMKRTILAKKESTYGTDAAPTGSNAILVRNMSVQMLNAETVGRDLIRPYYGNSDVLIAQSNALAEFEVELAGAGTPGIAPAWGELIEACSFSKTLNTGSVSITRSGAVATVTKTAHGYAIGDSIKISGATETEYNGTFTVATVPTADTFTYAVTGTPSTPATGTPVIGTNAVYTPISSTCPSITIYFSLDGIRQKITGARGTFEMSLNVKQIPVLKFTFTGIYNAPTDTADPSPDFTGFKAPKIANTTNTPTFSLFSYSGYLESMILSLNADIQYRTLIGYQEVAFVDRKPSGNFVVEMPTLAAKDFFALAIAGTTGALSLTHGIVTGNKVSIAAPVVSLQNPTIQESQNIAMLSLPFVPTPSSGNDEFTITCA